MTTKRALLAVAPMPNLCETNDNPTGEYPNRDDAVSALCDYCERHELTLASDNPMYPWTRTMLARLESGRVEDVHGNMVATFIIADQRPREIVTRFCEHSRLAMTCPSCNPE